MSDTPAPSSYVDLVREVVTATTMLTAVGKRLDDMAGSIRDLATEKSATHKALWDDQRRLEERVEALERFQARLYGVAAGIGIGSGIASSLVVQAIQGG